MNLQLSEMEPPPTAIFLQNRNSLHQSIEVWIGFDSTELGNLISLQSIHHLIIHFVLLDGSVSIAHEDYYIIGNIVRKLSNLTLSEDDTSRVLIIEIEHRHDERNKAPKAQEKIIPRAFR